MTEIERRLKQAEENEKARQSTGKGTTSTQTGRSAASSSSGRSDTERRLRIAEEQDRQAAKSSTWWEDYKRSKRYEIANRQLEKNRSRDAAEDEIRELTRNPFLSDAEWQARALQRNADRYKRDLTLYQEAMKNASTSGEYFSAHRQAVEAQSAVKHQFERYQQAAQKAEQDRDESNLVNRPALYASEHMTPEQISAELDRLRSGAATPTVTDKDRNDPVYAYMYPDAVLRKDPHGARFDERLVEDAGQDAIDALYRPILTEQEKAAVEEADRQIIEDKANRNYERVQILKAAQSMQTERTSRETGNKLMEEIATGGAAAKQVESGRAAFEAKQQQIASETSFEIGDDLESNRGAYNKMQKERRERGYILGYDWDNVPEDRKQAVYALYAEDPKKAIELAKFYIADVRQAADEEKQAWYAQNGWTAALGLVSSAAAHLGAAVDPFGDVGQELTRRGDNALAGGSQWADAATGYQKIPEWVPIVGGKGAGDFYQTVGSVVQSAAVAAPAILVGRYDKAAAEVVGKLGLALMGSSAAASDYRESVAAGMDEDRAKLHALAAGVEEALFEEVSLDKLIKMDTSGGLKAALKNWLVQSGIEGSEELATSIANRFTDEMISGAGQSKVERRASELIANGMNSTEAHTQAESEWMTDTLYDGFSGFLSGGMMTGGNYALQGAANLTERAVNAVETRKAQRQAGAAVSRSEGSVEALQAYAKDNGIEIKDVETAEQNAEQGGQGANQNSYSARDYRSISDTNSKVVQSIRSEVRGKTAQEQQAVRDSLVEKYGDGIAPAVYNAISIETASRVRQEYGSVDSIQAARNQAVSEIKDESLRRAVSDGYDSAAYSLAASQGGEGGMNTMSRYIQQRNNSGTGEMSMNATATEQDGFTKAIAITGMSEDGKRVSLADGSEVAVKDLQADADTTSAIQQLADLDLGADATKVLQAYQQSGVAGTEGYRWLMDYATAYNQGRTRQISLEQAAQRSSLDERTVMDAYTLGQQAANRETMEGLEKLKNLPKRKGANGRTANIDTTEIKGKTMSKSELEQFELANQYAQALGVDMKWFSSQEKDGKFVDKNGAYENGKIYMDIHAGRNFAADLTSGILATMGHELSHFEQQYAPEEYQALKEFLFEQIVKSSPNGEARLERLIWEKQRRSGYTLSRKAAEDEVVADACQKMLRDSKAVHDFASQQPQAANGVVRWLDKWFKKVRSIFGRGGNYSEEAQIMDSLEQDVKAAFGELWDKALKQAAKVHDEVGNIEKPDTEGESKAQNSDRDTEYLELAKDPEKNAAKLQEMVDEAAERAGYTVKAYHGTTENFTQFSQEKQGQNHKGYLEFGAGFYFTPSEKEARNWAERGKNGPARAKDSKVMAVYLNPGRIIEADNTIPGGKKYLEGIGLTEEDASFVANRAYRFINYLLEDKGYSNVEVQDRLKAMGFDAVEDTYRNRTEGQYVVFAPEQVKSADPITYDDQGNVIPLSERFNEANQDIRYSERDNAYRSSVDSGDLEAARKMVEDAANEAGYTIHAYHGTGSKFNSFDLQRSGSNSRELVGDSAEGMFFFSSIREAYPGSAQDYARIAGKRTGQEVIRDVYLKMENPLELDSKGWYATADYYDNNRDSIYDQYLSGDYDGIIIRDSSGGDDNTIYLLDDANRIKSAETVVYDDQGNLIPLSERFNPDNPDIRYSERDNAKPRSAQAQRDAGYKLSESKFYSLYSAHKLNMIGKGNVQEQISSIMADGFKGDGGFGNNVMPTNISYDVDENGKRIPRGLSAQKYAPKKGEYILLVPKEGVEVKGGRYNFTERVKPGYKPAFDYEIVQADYDGQPYYEMYEKAYDKSQAEKADVTLEGAQFSERDNPVDVDEKRNEPLTGQIGMFGQDGQNEAWTQPNLFDQTEQKKAKTGEELFLEEMDKFKKKLKKDGVWYGKEFDKFYAENPQMNFVERFYQNDPKTKADMGQFVAAIDDPKLLSDLSWYTTQSPMLKKGNYRGAVTKTRNVYKARINEIMAEKNNGHEIKLEHRKYSFDEVRGIFNKLNTNEAVGKLADKVFPVAKKLGLDIYATNKWYGERDAHASGAYSGMDVFLRINAFADKGQSDQHKATTILHEMIHACTVYAIDEYMRGGYSRTINQNILKAVEMLEKVYGQARGEIPINAYYGMKNLKEFVAELANPKFREELSKHNLFERVLDAIKRFFGIDRVKGPSYLDSASAALDYLLDEIDYGEAASYFVKAENEAMLWERTTGESRYSERDYSTPSDEELLMNARVEDAANVEQGQELKDYQALGKRIETLEKQLAEAKRQTQLTNRALNTRGIGNVVKTVMKDYDITDARHNGTAKNATLALTEGYQKALDLLDKGASPADVNDAVYNGAVKAAEIILEQGTYSQNLGGKWQTYSASRYLGDNSQELIDSFVSEAYADFVSNRYREARPETAADRLVARTKKEAQERVDKYKGRSDALAEANRRLEEKTTQAETEAKEARKAAGELFLEIKDLRQELMDNKTMSEQERKAASKKLKSLNKSLEAKREEAANWQKRAKRNASLLKSALESKNRDISALNNRLSKEQEAALEKQKRLEANLEKQIQRERDILAGKLRAPELVKMLKAEREKAEARVKKQKEQVFQNYKERKAATDLRGRIKNLSDEMKRRMTNPTDRAYVPASLYQSMTKLADVLDNVLSPNLGTKAEARYRAMMDAIRGMAREYEDVKNLDPVFASEYEQEISDAIGEIERILERKNASWIDNLTGDTQKGLAELNSDELQQLYDLMRQINYTITNATKVFGNSNYKSIFDAQRAVADQQNSMKGLNMVSRLERKKRLRLLNSLSVMRATEMMAGWDRSAALYQLMHGIEQGADDAWAWVMDYNKSLQDLKTGKNEKEYRQALTKQLDFGITDRDGLKVTMTKMQALQILMTAEREEHNDKLLHLQAGGAVIRNAIDLQNGKGAKARSQTISVTPELIQKINDSLTDWDRAYMKTVRDYFKREGKRTNEILYKLKHKVLKTEEFYVPYTVDRNYLEANLNEQQALNMWVKTPGSTNALKQKAKQPVIIDGMDTVMGQHVKEIGNYIGMAIPIRDFSKVYNGMIPTEGPNPLPVKETIERTFGKAGQHLLTQAVIDVQGGTARQNWESNIAQFLNKLQGAFVKSALLINPSVTIKQAASYIAAESVISHLALERGNHSVWARTDESKSFMPGGLIAQLFARPEGKTAQRIYNEIDQYTSLHYQRRQGMSMAEIAEQANRTGPIKRRINAIGASMEQSKIGHVARRTGENLNPLTWIQRMDVATTAALWVACKEQAKLDKLAVGSEEFWKRTTELYERCIRETQPMYDGLHRTANQKQAGGLMQYLFPFRTVPIQNHGQLAASYEAYKAARESKNEAKIKEAGKFFRKTVWAQTESAFVFSVMTFLAAILKRKTKKYRDEEGELDAGSFTKGLLTDVGSTLISVLNPMYGSELFNLGSRAVDKFEGNSGYTYDAFSVGVVDMINDLASSGDRLLADAGKIVRGENVNAADFWNHAMNLLVKGGKLAGIPADTVKTYFEGTKGNIQDAIEGRIPALNDESWERDAATNARRYLKAYLDNDTKKASAVLAELRSNLSKNGKDEGKINEAIRKYVSAQAVEKVADGTWTEEEAEAYLLSTGAYDDRENPQKDAWNAIRKGVAKSTSTDEEYSWKQYDELAEAVANGEDVTGLLTEYRDHGYSDDQINAAIRSGIQEALTAGDLDGNEAADALIRYGVTYSKDGKTVAYDEQTAWKKVQEWTDKAEHTDEEGELEDGYKYSAYSDLFEAVDANQNAEGIIQTMVQNGGYDTDGLRGQIKDHLSERFIAGEITETALKNQLARYCKITKTEDANEIVKSAKCKRDFGVSPDNLKEAFKDGDLSQNQAEKALQQYKGLSKTDAQNRVQYWGYDGDLSENAWLKWNNELKGSGLSVNNWEKVYEVKSSAKGTDANGDGRADSGTVKAEVVSYIDSMNIPKSQKKAIYLAFGWAASTMPNWR